MNELVDQLGAHLPHRGKETQPQIVRRHVGEEVGIERRVLQLERPDQHLFAVAQCDVVFAHTFSVIPARRPKPRLVRPCFDWPE